ncbi:uncharacterized protein LOC134181403 [Corticium candelabrum]|uniref:uncharacterized protein LOC134181403 n=1 Tax=Corticium candelabrum TaxID=121492 RepID=UPI002E2637A9|nr:uncharacterized protein LOC134181403 [Corticium candelabrum]
MFPVNRQHVSLGVSGCLYRIEKQPRHYTRTSHALQGVPLALLDAVKEDRLLSMMSSTTSKHLTSDFISSTLSNTQKSNVRTLSFVQTASGALSVWLESLSQCDFEYLLSSLQSSNYDNHLHSFHQFLSMVLQSGVEEGAANWLRDSNPEEWKQVLQHLLVMQQDCSTIQDLLPRSTGLFKIRGTSNFEKSIDMHQRHRRVKSAPSTRKEYQFSRHVMMDGRNPRPKSATVVSRTMQHKTFTLEKKEVKHSAVSQAMTDFIQNKSSPKKRLYSLPKTLFEIKTPRRLVPHNHRSLLPHPPFSLERPRPQHFFLRPT